MTSAILTEPTRSDAASAPTSTEPSSEEQIAQAAIELLQAGGDVVLPEGLTEMYGLADLLYASSPTVQPVTSITRPNSYVYLTMGSGCEGLETVENLYTQENNPHYRSIDGVLFSLDGETLILFPPGRTGTYTVPDGVKYIGGRAFEYSQLTELYLADSVERMGMYACDLMGNLCKISLPRGFAGGLDGCFAAYSIRPAKWAAERGESSARKHVCCIPRKSFGMGQCFIFQHYHSIPTNYICQRSTLISSIL